MQTADIQENRILDQRPIPLENEYPTSYADRMGRWYARFVSEDHKKGSGQYLTPMEVAKFMARACKLKDVGTLRVLDPGAGAGILSCPYVKRLLRILIVA